MKKFLVRIGITLFILVVVAFAIDRLITNNLHHSNARIFKSWNDLFYGNLQCDAVIMGSSRGMVQYCPSILDSVLDLNFYNISVDGRSIDAEVVKYNTYCLYNKKPKLILQNVDWGTLTFSNGYETEQFLPYLFCDSLYKMTKQSENFTWGDRYIPLVRYAGYFQVIKEGLKLPNKLDKPQLYKGYCGRDKQWDGSQFDQVEEVEFCHDTAAVCIFEDYLQQCRQDGIQVVFVFAPIYIGVTEKMDNPQQMFDFYESLATKYNCQVLNYTYNYLSYDTVYFYNAMHLNKTGAELFSKQLGNDLLDIINKEDPNAK